MRFSGRETVRCLFRMSWALRFWPSLVEEAHALPVQEASSSCELHGLRPVGRNEYRT